MSFNRTYNLTWTGTVDPSMVAAAQEVTTRMEDVHAHTITLGETTERAARIGTRAFRGYVFGVQMSIFYVSMLANAWMRAESAQLSLIDAQENYQRTLAEYGPAHERTEAALRRLERAQLMVQRTSFTTMLTFGGMTLQMFSMTVQTLAATGAIGIFTGATTTATAANVTHTTSIWGRVAALKALIIAQAAAHPWLLPAMLAAGGAAAVGLMAWGAMRRPATVKVESEFNIGASVEQLQAALKEQERKATYELRRATGG